ncbi:MAG TPA: NAD(P)H-quinone oxidoreductase [Candidatus Polarisedimenticolaceae bacterium]|nr:NAD(P)H-quinone oxidoreductase [Candidatus Polarisedimenticolaceae bacterium]
MRAVVIDGAGGPEVLHLRSVPDPVPGAEELLVAVRASALNRADLLQRRGLYPAPPDAPPDVPGLEFAGTVSLCGERVRGWRPGDRVMGLLPGGGHAERVAVHERLCLAVPPALGWEEAAAIPEAFLTAYDALFRQGELAAGEVVLLHAAASGVGTAALQLAAVAGARVIALSRTADKRARLERLGAHRVLAPDGADLIEAIRLAAGGSGVDLVLDMVGAPTWRGNLEVLRECGRLVVIGLLGGATVELDLARLMRRRLRLIGSVLRSRPVEQKIVLVQEFARCVLPLFAAGRLRAIVDRALPLERAAEAHALLERNATFGKVVLTIGDGA